jgi:hypothetical protein
MLYTQNKPYIPHLKVGALRLEGKMKFSICGWKNDSFVYFQNIFTPPKTVTTLEKYKEWVLETYKTNDTEVYETGVGFSDGGGSLGFPHLTEKYNAGEEHVKQLNNWIKHYEEEGYTVGISFEQD